MITEKFHDLVHEQGGCRISDTASRAITIEQLARVLQHLQSRLDRGEVFALSLWRTSPLTVCLQELSYIMYNGETRTIENVEQANLYGESVTCDLAMGDTAAHAGRHQHVGDSSSDRRAGLQPGGDHGQRPR